MDEPSTRPFWSLIKPLGFEDVRITDEEEQYGERLHWAVLIESFLETMTVLVIITVLTGDGSGTTLGILLILGSLAYLIYRLLRNGAQQAEVYAQGLALFGGYLAFLAVLALMLIIVAGIEVTAVFNPTVLALLTIFFFTARFTYRTIIWMFYQKLFITNRRVILAQAFFGSDVSTMPLTRVTDINYETTVPGQLLGYANIRVETAGQDQALSDLHFLEKPALFYNTLIRLSTAAVGSSSLIP